MRSEILMGNRRFLSRGHSPSDYLTHPDGTMNLCKPNGYLVQTETYIVRPPACGQHDYPPMAGCWRIYDVIEDSTQWQRSPSPLHGRPLEVKEFITSVQTETGRPSSLPRQVPRNWSYNSDPPGQENCYSGYQSYEARQPTGLAMPVSCGTYPTPLGYGQRVSMDPRSPPPPALGTGSWAKPRRSACLLQASSTSTDT
ncbi:hypothetical protein SAY87_008351 [Trapa incisa]|uniref:Uncharacterized protein n=1 Tax=Trapa incisa TaxID=236973 RepID=A0AAN7KKE0_9MYRT|nr:hypothetical protein SAY87_008351 [Trapa incisa]